MAWEFSEMPVRVYDLRVQLARAARSQIPRGCIDRSGVLVEVVMSTRMQLCLLMCAVCRWVAPELN